MWSRLAQLASREHLPPGGTVTWSAERRWSRAGQACNVRSKASGGPPQFVDEPWHADWEEDRLGVLREVRAIIIVIIVMMISTTTTACRSNANHARGWLAGWLGEDGPGVLFEVRAVPLRWRDLADEMTSHLSSR